MSVLLRFALAIGQPLRRPHDDIQTVEIEHVPVEGRVCVGLTQGGIIILRVAGRGA